MAAIWTEKKGLILRDGTSVDLKRLAEYLNIVEDERAARLKLKKETEANIDLRAKKVVAEFKIAVMEAEAKKEERKANHKKRKEKSDAKFNEIMTGLDSLMDDITDVIGVKK